MCELLPELDNCCRIFTLRIGILLIAVFAIMTGCITLSAVEKVADASLQQAVNSSTAFTNNSNNNYKDIAKLVFSNLSSHILNAVFVMAVFFMIAGIFLLAADLTDEQGFAQVFVFIVTITVVIGMVLILALGYDCINRDICLLDMDWLSIAFVLTGWFFFMLLWIYFLAVVNSYALNGDTQY